MTRKRILFIDGDDGFVRDVADMISLQGYDAAISASSTDGVERARQERPDLIVVNVELAPTNGWSVCTKLKKDDDLKGIPIILTSSLSPPDTFEKHKKLKTRADEYLLKPYDADEFIRVASGLIGVPDAVSPMDEDLVVEDESLATGDFDMTGLDEEIPVLDDEPLATPALNGFAHDPIDPLASSTSDESQHEEALSAADLDELPLEFGALPPEPSPLAIEDDLAAFDESFASLTPAPFEAATAFGDETGAASSQPEDEASFEEFSDEQLLGATGAGRLDVGTAATLTDSESAVSFGQDEIAFDETPIEIQAEHEFGASAQLPADGFDSIEVAGQEFGETPSFGSETFAEPLSELPADDGFATAGFGDSAPAGELEARVAELEAEIEGYKATESSRDEELERLRVESARKDSDADQLRELLIQRERTIREMKDAESRAASDAAKARDEKVRREAAMKALTLRAEQVTTQAKQLERALLVAREELKSVAALKTRSAELEQAHADALNEVAAARAELEAQQRDHEATRAAHTQTSGELELTRAEAEAVRSQVEAAKREAEEARSQLDSAKQEAEELRPQIEAARLEASELRPQLDAARQEAEQLRPQLDAARQEAEQLRPQLDAARQEAEQLRPQLDTARQEAEQLRQQLDTDKHQLERLQSQLETAHQEAEQLRPELESLREAASHTQAEVTNLREQLAAAEDRIKELAVQAQTANERATRARSALRQAVEHLGHETEAN
jgi:ActR/RegA family two-component response regulator/predicted  nucleic acid-binding Zn-ribbon protein